MPQSKSRHAHKHPHQHPHQPPKTPHVQSKPKDSNRVILIAVLFFGFLGLAIGYFIDAASPTVLITSTALGAGAGFVFGYSMKKSLPGNK